MRREFPDHPLVGVGGVVIQRGRVLLIRRGGEPLKGEWSIPGGLLELGEELAEGVRRELREETGLEVEPLEVLAVFDRILYDAAKHSPRPAGKKSRQPRRVRYHYVIVDYVCRRQRGRLAPASDVVDARWVRREDLANYHLTEMATSVVNRAFEFFGKGGDRGEL
jgi:8-oxo-dGTP diphosphatase